MHKPPGLIVARIELGFDPGRSQATLGVGHMLILDFRFDGGTENVTKWHYNSSPGLIIGAFCTIPRARPV